MTMPENAEPVRYFRNCEPTSYCMLVGDQVTYFSHNVPDGYPSSDITRSVVLAYAQKQPHLDGEISLERVNEIRQGWNIPCKKQ